LSKGCLGISEAIFLLVELASVMDREQQVFGQRVDDGDADAM